jgi:hypothetical protein
MRGPALVLAALVGCAGAAQARCADDLKQFQARLARTAKAKPTPQTAAATKELKRYDTGANQGDEVDCYNTLARARRALNAPSPVEKPVPVDDNRRRR